MADQHDAHAAATTAGPHGATADHGGDHGDDDGHDEHAHDGAEALGPFDLPAWGAAGLGVVLGLVVVYAFIQAAA